MLLRIARFAAFINVLKKGRGDFLKMSIYHRVTIFT